MKGLCVVAALLAVTVVAWSLPEAEKAAAVAKELGLIAVDGERLYHDLAGNPALTAAAADVVKAYGHVTAATAVLVHGHSGKFEAAAKELEQAAVSIHDAYQTLADNDDLKDARVELGRLLSDVADLVYALRGGNLGESCSSRCSHECSGLDVAACALNCVHGNSCHPSCCGCKDGTAGCDACGSSCTPGEVAAGLVSCQAA